MRDRLSPWKCFLKNDLVYGVNKWVETIEIVINNEKKNPCYRVLYHLVIFCCSHVLCYWHFFSFEGSVFQVKDHVTLSGSVVSQSIFYSRK